MLMLRTFTYMPDKVLMLPSSSSSVDDWCRWCAMKDEEVKAMEMDGGE